MKNPLITRCAAFLFIAFSVFAGAGCAELTKEAAIGAAQDPYRKAMLAGKITPVDYRRESEAIRQAAGGSK
jgi:hypothetical protein